NVYKFFHSCCSFKFYLFLRCILYETSSKIASGNILENALTHLFKTPGIMINLPFRVLSIPYFATLSLDILGALNTTFATLLKFVLTGPGHNILILTFDLFFFSSLFIALVNLITYAFEA